MNIFPSSSRCQNREKTAETQTHSFYTHTLIFLRSEQEIKERAVTIRRQLLLFFYSSVFRQTDTHTHVTKDQIHTECHSFMMMYKYLFVFFSLLTSFSGPGFVCVFLFLTARKKKNVRPSKWRENACVLFFFFYKYVSDCFSISNTTLLITRFHDVWNGRLTPVCKDVKKSHFSPLVDLIFAISINF